jgi:hypothetical protein
MTRSPAVVLAEGPSCIFLDRSRKRVPHPGCGRPVVYGLPYRFS